MSALLNIRDKIDQATEMIARHEAAMAKPNARSSLAVSIRSLEKLRSHLEEQFLEAAAESEIEVYRYRVIPEDRATIVGLSEAWASFQKFFSAVYQGVGETRGARADVDLFGFAYTFPGSVGVALTLPSKQGLLDDPLLVEATEAVFDLSESREQRPVDEAALRLGPEVIRSMHGWVNTLIEHNYGAGLSWRDREITIDPRRLSSLRDRVALTAVRLKVE